MNSIDEQVAAYRSHLESKMRVLVDQFAAEYRDHLTRMRMKINSVKIPLPKTISQAIVDVMSVAGKPVTARQLSEATDISIGSIRGTLYLDLEDSDGRFRKHGSGRRVTWSLRASSADTSRKVDA